jgi:hypothetical protein
MELLEGFDELEPEWKEKVMRAIEEGHVDDEDWRGGPDRNYAVKTPVSRRKKEAEDDGVAPESGPKKTKSRKRKAVKEEEEAPVAEVPAIEAPAVEADDAKPAKKRSKRVAAKKFVTELENEEGDVKPTASKTDGDLDDDEPKKKRAVSKKTSNAGQAKKGATKKTFKEPEVDMAEDAHVDDPPKKSRRSARAKPTPGGTSLVVSRPKRGRKGAAS